MLETSHVVTGHAGVKRLYEHLKLHSWWRTMLKDVKLFCNLCEICKKNKTPYGIHVVNPEINELKRKISEGYKFIAYGIDSVFITKSAKIDLEVIS